jgi:hypothetical protein
MVADIFLKTYAGDVRWLPQCLKHIRHYMLGFRRLVIVCPPEIVAPVKNSGTQPEDKIVILPEGEDGYFFQQSCKLHAHNLTNASHICFMDSDCLARRHCRPQDFLVRGKPHFLHTPYTALEGSGADRWKPGTEFVIQKLVQDEFMRRHPAFYPRRVLIKFDRWMQGKHNHAASQFMRLFGRELVLSEFNILGAWSWYHAHDEFTWLDTTTDVFPPDFVEQFWSYGGPEHPCNADRYRAIAL